MDNVNGSNMPSLWVFLVIVLAVLLGVVLSTSFIMHMIQRRQRKQLQRRIANGEVDLEALGIKRLNVPQEAIEKMPQYTFKSVSEGNSNTSLETANTENNSQDFFQPTCSICLDDFVFEQTKVRELPCKHIFHPDCIDPFLRENSSLCPLCKRSALPTGYCPITVTNVMVRRERLTRQMRNRAPQPQYPRYQAPTDPGIWGRRLDRLRGPSSVAAPQQARVRGSSPVHGAPQMVEPTSPVRQDEDTELGPIRSQDSVAGDAAQPPPDVARRGTVARRNWRRERVASLHAREYYQQEERARQEDARRPLWRRMLGVA